MLRYEGDMFGQGVDLQNAQVTELLQRLLQRSGGLGGVGDSGGQGRNKHIRGDGCYGCSCHPLPIPLFLGPL